MGWEDDLIKTLEKEIEKDKDPTSLYNKSFYQDHEKYRPVYNFLGDLISAVIQPKSVLDLGCGAAFLLEKLKENGITDLHGIEGSADAEHIWNAGLKEYLEVKDILQYKPERQYDLVVCMEVAEHIAEDKADKLIKIITKSSGAFVWFTAAQPGQGGTGHVNCKDLCYWARKFEDCRFVPKWELGYELKTQMLKIPDITQAYPWFRDNLLIFQRVR